MNSETLKERKQHLRLQALLLEIKGLIDNYINEHLQEARNGARIQKEIELK